MTCNPVTFGRWANTLNLQCLAFMSNIFFWNKCTDNTIVVVKMPSTQNASAPLCAGC